MHPPRLPRLPPALILLAAVPTMPAAAQQLSPEPGQRVRATMADGTVTGSLLRLDSARLVIADEGWNTTVEVPRPALERLEVWTCCSATGGFVRGAALGTGVALAIGGILLALPSDSHDGANIGAGVVILLGVPVGALLGGLVGTATLAPHRWQPVWLPATAPDATGGLRPGRSLPTAPISASPKALRYQAFR